jgi:hypothetical protein
MPRHDVMIHWTALCITLRRIEVSSSAYQLQAGLVRGLGPAFALTSASRLTMFGNRKSSDVGMIGILPEARSRHGSPGFRGRSLPFLTEPQ